MNFASIYAASTAQIPITHQKNETAPISYEQASRTDTFRGDLL